MDLSIYLIIGVVIILATIIINHSRQKKRMQNFLQDSADIQPMLLMQAVEKKIGALTVILYSDGLKPDAQIPNPKRDLIIALDQLKRDYAAQKIPLRTYDKQLFALLEKAKKLPATA